MTEKIRVYGKAQNRTALGIINAYCVMYPQATLEDLKKAFPDALNTDQGFPIVMSKQELDATKGDKGGEWYFTGEDELISLQGKKKIAVKQMWTKPNFERLVGHASQYGIVVAEFEKAMRGEKGGFRLEYLNGYVPPAPAKSKTGLWIALAAILAALAAFFMFRSCQEPEVVEKVVEVEKIVTVVDTVYAEKIEEIEKNFNNAQFDKGKAELGDDAKFVLHDLAKLMTKHPELKVKIVGHTSADGDANYNLKLSEGRAKAAVDFLLSRDIDESRLKWEGKGSQELKDPSNPNSEVNRRTEFIVFE
jgi:outer membrane protein OmpA-like peptidoglycan-associated protein